MVEPLYPINIGYMARCMKNFGLEKLFLVRPRTPLTDEAYRFSVHASDILDKAVITEDLNTAIKDVNYVIGTTGKVSISDYNVDRIPITPDILSRNLKRFNGSIGIVFGREDIGLKNEELDKCDCIVNIPANPKYPILNITHAAVIIFYEFYKVCRPARRGRLRAPTDIEKDVLYKYFDLVLDKIELPEFKKRIAGKIFRRMVGRAFLTGREVYTLIGVFRKLEEKLSSI